MAYSYSTQGATPSAPQIGPSSYTSLQSAGLTPYSNALNGTSGSYSLGLPTSFPSSTGGMQTTTPSTSTPTDFSKLASTSGLIPKSQTITNADGSSHTTTYHAPTQPLTAEQIGAANASQNTAVAKTPEEMAATNTTGTGAGSKDPTVTQTPPPPATPTFGGIIGSVVQGATQPNQAYGDAHQEYVNAVNDYNKLQSNEVSSLGNVSGITEPLEFQQGQKQILENQYSQQLAAAGAKVQGMSAALGAANTQQQTQQAGLLGAATATSPQLGQPGQAYYQPLQAGNGTATGGAGITPEVMSSMAQLAANGQISQVPSSITGNPVLLAQLNAAAKAINPSYTPLTSAAQGAATSTNIQTGGTAATSAAASGLQQATQAYVSANTAYTTAQNQSSNLQQTMAETGVNTNPQFVNSKINTLQNQMGSDKYVSFITALSEAKQAYTNLLSSVGASTPTVNGQQATDIFNQNSTPSQINAAITALNQAAYAKLKPMYDQIGTYSSQLGGSSGGTGGTSGSSGSVTAGGYSFVQNAQGQWVPA